MSGDFLKRKLRNFENRITGGSGADQRIFLRDRARRLERDMNTELPNKVNEARQGFQLVNRLSQKGDNLTDNDVITAISAAEPIKDFYQNYYQYLDIGNDGYRALTREFTEQRNSWWKAKTPSTMEFGPSSSYAMASSDPVITASLRHSMIQTTREFLRNATNHLNDRLNPGLETREEIAQQIHQHRGNAMGQRWRELIEQPDMVDMQVPDQNTELWAKFVSEKYDAIVAEKGLNPESRGANIIADIMMGGNVNEISETDRDSPGYKDYMKYVLRKYQDFLTHPENLTT
jgi:hypothetical protein